MARAPLMPYGVPTIYPFIPGVPNYHNGSVWPFVGAFWMWAGAESGHGASVEHGIATSVRSAALFLTNKENLVAATGHFEGTALNSDRQLWSVAGQLAVQYRTLFGLRAEETRLAVRPMVPPAYAGERKLEGLRYREADVTIIVRGFGNGVARATLNGESVPYAEIPSTKRGSQVLVVEMNGRWPEDVVTIRQAAVAPETPPQPMSIPQRGGRVDVEWRAVEGAQTYQVLIDGRLRTDIERPVGTGITLPVTDVAQEVQVVAVSADGQASFPSEPLRVVASAREHRVALPSAQQRLSASDTGRVRVQFRVPYAGHYAVEALYANGNGPINTEDKAAIRSLFVDGTQSGVLVMPQRGAGNWSEFGWSTAATVTLAEGVHEIALAYTADDRNMNGRVNEAIVRELRFTRVAGLPPAPPQILKVEPPNWWVGHSVNPVRILVRGRNLDGATLRCGALRCSNIKVSASGTYVFADVEVPNENTASIVRTHMIALETAGGRTQFGFTVESPLERRGRFAGIGADDLIYFVMPDRFADGDTTNNDPVRSRGLYDRRDAKAYHGGDLEGLRQKLPYLRQLGVTAIWMTPVYENVDTVAHRMRLPETGRPYTDYHGYGATDLYAVDDHLGDLATLRRLVDDAHAAGIKIILDQVANHTGPEHVWAADPPTPTWYNGTLAKHLPNNWQMGSLTDANASPAVQDSTLRGWFADILPDFNQDDPEVERYLIQNTLWWVGISGADAVRQDTWPYVHRRFWRPWMAALKREYPALTVVGELWSEDVATVAFFEGTHEPSDGIVTGVDQLFDFPLQAAARRVFARGEEIRQLAQVLAQDRLYDHPERLMTFLENHDMPRLPWDSTATTDGLLLAYTFLYTVRGIPKLYYGNEIGMSGGGDPDNRRDFPGGFAGDTRDAFTASGRTADEQRIFAHLEALAKLRAARPDLRQARM
jgi:glycosidase